MGVSYFNKKWKNEITCMFASENPYYTLLLHVYYLLIPALFNISSWMWPYLIIESHVMVTKLYNFKIRNLI